MEKVRLQHPRLGTVEVGATPEALTPLMAQGYSQVAPEAPKAEPVPVKETHVG